MRRCDRRLPASRGAIIVDRMPKKGTAPTRATKPAPVPAPAPRLPSARPSSLIDTRVIYCGDCLEQLRKLPDACVDLIYIDPTFNPNRNYEVFWGETKERPNERPHVWAP